jgi:hypothetical protein
MGYRPRLGRRIGLGTDKDRSAFMNQFGEHQFDYPD